MKWGSVGLIKKHIEEGEEGETKPVVDAETRGKCCGEEEARARAPREVCGARDDLRADEFGVLHIPDIDLSLKVSETSQDDHFSLIVRTVIKDKKEMEEVEQTLSVG